MHILSKYFLSMQVKRYFKKSDKDRNGSLTKEEWYNVLNSSGVPTTEQVDEVANMYPMPDQTENGI